MSEEESRGDDHVLRHKLGLLREAIDEVDRAIASRRSLTKKFRQQIEKELEEALRYLDTLPPPWRAGFLPQIEFLRLSLHKSP